MQNEEFSAAEREALRNIFCYVVNSFHLNEKNGEYQTNHIRWKCTPEEYKLLQLTASKITKQHHNAFNEG